MINSLMLSGISVTQRMNILGGAIGPGQEVKIWVGASIINWLAKI